MSASASLLTGKNRRRALQALIAGPLLALGVAAGSGTAHASDPVFTPAEVHLSDGHCAVSGWPHGEIFCGTSVGANFPNGTQEIFGIGLNEAVWTDWGTEARPSGWKSMGAPPNTRCDPSSPVGLANDGDYALLIWCYDINGTLWFNERGSGASAGWSGWGLLAIGRQLPYKQMPALLRRSNRGGRWRPSSVSPWAAAFARDVVARVSPEGRAVTVEFFDLSRHGQWTSGDYW